MKKIRRKLISGAVLAFCAVFSVAAGSELSGRSKDEAVMVSAQAGSTPPIIVLDAGHGGSSKT